MAAALGAVAPKSAGLLLDYQSQIFPVKSKKKPGAERLLTAVAKSVSDAPKVEEWNFSLCPHPNETEACYLYEYSLECDSIRAEAKKLREKSILSAANEQKFKRWLRRNPMPRTRGIEQDRWCKRALKANPNVVVTTKLSYELHFLGDCAHFPSKHWLQISAEERAQLGNLFRPDRMQWGHDAFHMETRGMLIQSVEEYLSSPFRNIGDWLPSVPEHSGDFVVSWCWPRSNRKLLQDFKEWLEENRPPDQPPLHKTGESTTRKTSQKDLLKALGALRLMRAFKNNFSEARYHAWEVIDKPLFRDQAAWIKAKNRAEQEIEAFKGRMLHV